MGVVAVAWLKLGKATKLKAVEWHANYWMLKLPGVLIMTIDNSVLKTV